MPRQRCLPRLQNWGMRRSWDPGAGRTHQAPLALPSPPPPCCPVHRVGGSSPVTVVPGVSATSTVPATAAPVRAAPATSVATISAPPTSRPSPPWAARPGPPPAAPRPRTPPGVDPRLQVLRPSGVLQLVPPEAPHLRWWQELDVLRLHPPALVARDLQRLHPLDQHVEGVEDLAAEQVVADGCESLQLPRRPSREIFPRLPQRRDVVIRHHWRQLGRGKRVDAGAQERRHAIQRSHEQGPRMPSGQLLAPPPAVPQAPVSSKARDGARGYPSTFSGPPRSSDSPCAVTPSTPV